MRLSSHHQHTVHKNKQEPATFECFGFWYKLTAIVFLSSAAASFIVALCYYADILYLGTPYQCGLHNNGLNYPRVELEIRKWRKFTPCNPDIYSPTHSPLLGLPP